MIRSAIAGLCHAAIGTSVEWRCRPHAPGQRIYFGNHSSHLDFVVIWSALPAGERLWVRPVAAADYWERSAIRRSLARKVFNAVLVERRDAASRGTPGAACAATERIASAMGERYSLIFFPEGTRSPHGHVGAFKSGLYFLSRLRPDVELIPVYLENLGRILPKDESLPVPLLNRVVFGPPLRTGGDEDKQQFLDRARTAVIELGGHDAGR